MDTPRQKTDTILAQTKHLEFVDRDGWSFTRRIGSTGVVSIVATTDDGRLILVEQYRPPVQKSVIELPAGLAGDLDGRADETFRQAAERELLEETGYVARNWKQHVTLASSAGLTDEVITFFLAEDLEKKTSGGGDASEDIRVHAIPLSDIERWLDEADTAGKLIDARVYTGLYFLTDRKEKARRYV